MLQLCQLPIYVEGTRVDRLSVASHAVRVDLSLLETKQLRSFLDVQKPDQKPYASDGDLERLPRVEDRRKELKNFAFIFATVEHHERHIGRRRLVRTDDQVGDVDVVPVVQLVDGFEDDEGRPSVVVRDEIGHRRTSAPGKPLGSENLVVQSAGNCQPFCVIDDQQF